MKKILGFSGSTRKDSYNKKLLSLALNIAEENKCKTERIELLDFEAPIYDGDIESKDGVPQKIIELAQKIKNCDALVISSPEYNLSIPGGLKNTIDWLSRHKPQPFKGKSILLLSASPSMVGGNRGLWSLRVPLEALGAFVYPDMFSLALCEQAFDENLQLKDQKLSKTLEAMLVGFIAKIC
jgi:chromate reductase, NAD(P)H dehydrogenase (quinone)